MEQLFYDILCTQSESGNVTRMTALVEQYAKSFGADVIIKDGNVYVTKGQPLADGYPCVVSHTDTVHKIVPDRNYSVHIDTTHGIAYAFDYPTRSFTGIGGDDKCGIYIALAAVRDFDSIKACFFRDEEIGCIGSAAADMDFFSDCMYILQCDRKGNADFVTKISGTALSSKAFQDDIEDIIKSFGYSFKDGGMTDVLKLTTRGVGISTANMSCGYFYPHSDEEIVVLEDVENTKDMVYAIIKTLDKKYPHKYEPVSYGYGTKYNVKKGGSYYDYPYGYGIAAPQPVQPAQPPAAQPSAANHTIDWYSDCPEDDVLINMNNEDIWAHIIAVCVGYEYQGRGLYKVLKGGFYTFERLSEIDAIEEQCKIDDDNLWSEIEDFCEYLVGTRDDLIMKHDFPTSECEDTSGIHNCIICGDPMAASDAHKICRWCSEY